MQSCEFLRKLTQESYSYNFFFSAVGKQFFYHCFFIAWPNKGGSGWIFPSFKVE